MLIIGCLALVLLIYGCGPKKSIYECATEEEKCLLRNRMLGTLVHIANDNHFSIVQQYLDEGIPPSSCDSNGFPGVHCAMVHHSPKTVMLLIERGADINARDPDSATLLHYAAAAGYPSIVKYLIDHGADVNARALHGLTPTLLAAYVWYFTPADSLKLIWKYLMEAGADPNAVDDEGNNALYRAIMHKFTLEYACYPVPNIWDNTYERGGICSMGGLRVQGTARSYSSSSVLYVLKPLMQHGTSPDVKNDKGLSAREVAENQYKYDLKKTERDLGYRK
jgi:hypothetical protein